MARKIAYWVSTILLAALSALSALAYLSGSPQAVQGFAHVGYPQQLRIMLGIAKPLGAMALLAPGLPKLKEWAYAGFAFAWISAFVAPLPRERWRDGFCAARAARAPLCFLLHPPRKPPVIRAGIGSIRSTRLVRAGSLTFSKLSILLKQAQCCHRAVVVLLGVPGRSILL